MASGQYVWKKLTAENAKLTKSLKSAVAKADKAASASAAKLAKANDKIAKLQETHVRHSTKNSYRKQNHRFLSLSPNW